MGATDRFIRRPFLYDGCLYGLAGAATAWLLVNLLLMLLYRPAVELAGLYGSSFRPAFLDVAESGALFGSAIVLGLASAISVVSYQLRRPDHQ
jgi:cell division transport system permease protein